jgi:hypothetical protein
MRTPQAPSKIATVSGQPQEENHEVVVTTLRRCLASR